MNNHTTLIAKYLHFFQSVSHTFFFGFHVGQIVGIGVYFDRYIFDYFESVGLQSDAFYGVVGHQSHFRHAQFAQYAGANAIVALIGFEPEMQVGIDGVVALLLQFVGCYFGHQPDAAPFLIHIQHNAFAFFFDDAHGLVQLIAALAAARTEYVARGARRMHSDKYRLVGRPCAFDEGNVLQSVRFLTKRNQMKMSVLRGHIHFVAPFDERFFL